MWHRMTVSSPRDLLSLRRLHSLKISITLPKAAPPAGDQQVFKYMPVEDISIFKP